MPKHDQTAEQIEAETDALLLEQAKAFMTAKAVIEALIHEKGYKKEELPALSTMRGLLGKMGYRLRRVQKTKPQKKFPKPMRFSPTSKRLMPKATRTIKHCESR